MSYTIEDLRQGRILITGASGFLGGHLHRLLTKKYGCTNVLGAGYSGFSTLRYPADVSYDLRSRQEVYNLVTNQGGFDFIFNLAGWNGNLQLNREQPARIFYDNTVMTLNLLEAAWYNQPNKILNVVASCAYEPDEDGECYEGTFFAGEPDPTVACHGMAKRNVQLACRFYHQQYGLGAVCVCPTTLYGPGDSFDLAKTKVMGALIKRFVDAVENGEKAVTLWGSGKPLREFLYVEDCADLMVKAMLSYDNHDFPLNLGSGQEYSIRDLAHLIAGEVRFAGNILWDTEKPDGQYRKRLDLTRMKGYLGDFHFTPIKEGIRRTIDYYRSTKTRLAG